VMIRLLPLLVCTWALLPSLAAADEPENGARWLVELRNSGSKKKGMQEVREKIESVYDLGAVAGASQWDAIHDYYIEVARTKGCQKGTPYADGPVKACHKRIERANDAEHEPVCAKASKTWADALLRKLRKQIEAHGLPVGKRPE